MRGLVAQKRNVSQDRRTNLEVHVRDEGQVEFGVVCDGVVALAEEPQEALPLLEGVVVLPHQEAHEAELKLRQDLVGPERGEIILIIHLLKS